MKILHTSDWHLGLEFFGVDPTADQQHMIGEIVRIAREQQVGAVIVAGDVFDRAVVAPDAIALYNDAMRALCLELGLPVVLIAGNHDGAARLSTLSDLLRGAGLYIAGRVTTEEMQADLGDTVIHLLPYVYTDDVRQAYPARREEIACAADAMRVVLEERRPPKDGKRHILAAHCFAAGGQAGQSDRAAAVGGSLAVLGHLHRPQTLGGGKLRYSGTPMCTSFAETDVPRSVTIVDTNDMSLKEVPVEPLHVMRTLRGTREKLCEGSSQDYLRLIVTDEFPTAPVQEALRRTYPNALQIDCGMQIAASARTGLTLEEVRADSPLDVAEKFYLNRTGREMDDEMRAWFRQAIEDAEREG